MKPLSALRYVGGKSANSTTGAGRWIASQLPHSEAYFEPFAGMLGVLLQRASARVEVVNDLDGRVANWWRTIRDNSEELEDLFLRSPKWSNDLFWEAVGKCDGEGLMPAYYYTLLLHWGFGGKAGQPYIGRAPGFLTRKSTSLRTIEVARLAERMSDVIVENIDVCSFIDAWKDTENSVWYVDPPYLTDQSYYRQVFDRERFVSLLGEIKGRVAVSGYGSEWDVLGWSKQSREVSTPLQADGASRRLECLWSNW